MDDSSALKAAVFEELKAVRRRGVSRLDIDNPDLVERETTHLEKAARRVPGYRPGLPRSVAVRLLLEHELEQLQPPLYRTWLRISFGLDPKLDTVDPVELRKKAMAAAGERNQLTFERGKEKEALTALAAQIVADCLLAEAETNRDHKRFAIWAIAATAALALIAVAIIYTPKFRTSGISDAANNSTPAPNTSVPTSSTVTTTPRITTTSPTPPPQPLHIDRVAEVHTVPQGYTYAFSRKLNLTSADLSSLNGLNAEWAEYNQWMKTRGGVPSFDAAVQVVLRGTLPQTVVISDIRIIKQCGPYLKGALMYSPPAGQDNSVEIGFDLDKQLSVAQNYQSGQLSGTYFTSHTVSLKQGETFTLVMHATTKRQYCKYHFELVVTTGEGGEPVKVKVDNKGKPFEVTATADVQNEGAENTMAKFTDYQEVYAGGVASPDGWRRVNNPTTFRGDCSGSC